MSYLKFKYKLHRVSHAPLVQQHTPKQASHAPLVQQHTPKQPTHLFIPNNFLPFKTPCPQGEGTFAAKQKDSPK